MSDHTSPTTLHVAVANGDKDLVEVLLNKGANTDVQNQNGMNCLHIATLKGNLEIVDLLSKNVSLINSRVCIPELYPKRKKFGGYTPLHFAVKNGNDKLTELLLCRGADVNAVEDRYCNCPLHSAVHNKQKLIIIRQLLSRKCDVDKKNYKGYSALHFAVKRSHVEIIEELLANGASVNLVQNSGDTVLHTACRMKNLLVVKALLSHNADLNFLNLCYFTPLHVATSHCCLEIVEFLLKSGAKCNLVNKRGNSALHIACQKNNPPIVKVLLNHGSFNSCQNNTMCTPLHIASLCGFSEIVDLLLESGANVHLENSYGTTALLNACRKGYMQAVQSLLKFGSNVNSQNKSLSTALHLATIGNYPEIVEQLLSSGADANICDSSGETPLHIACKMCNDESGLKDHVNLVSYETRKKNSEKIIRLLLRNGCNLDIQNKRLYTALHYTAENNCVDLAEILLQGKADVNVPNYKGFTALHLACECGNKQLVEILLLYGCDIEIIAKGKTALLVAVEHDFIDGVELLLKAGADIYEPTRALVNSTPFHFACRSNNTTVVQIFLNHGYNVNYGVNRDPLICHAANYNSLEVSKILLEHGADVDSFDSCNCTPLHHACTFSNVEMVKLFLSYGCSIDIKWGRQTAVVTASRLESFEIYELLLDYGGGVDIKEDKIWVRNCNVQTMYKFIAKRKAGNLEKRYFMNAENLEILVHRTKFYKQCKEEIKSMKEFVLENTCFTVYDVFKKDLNTLLVCLNDDNIVRAMKSDLLHKFPIYGNMIQFWYWRGLKRKTLIDECRKYLFILISSLRKLPYNCVDIVIDKLSNKDLLAVIKIFRPTYIYLPPSC